MLADRWEVSSSGPTLPLPVHKSGELVADCFLVLEQGAIDPMLARPTFCLFDRLQSASSKDWSRTGSLGTLVRC